MHALRLSVSIAVVSFVLAAPLPAQSRGRERSNRAAPPAAPGAGAAFGGAPIGGLGATVLRPRKLENRTLDEKEQKKYDALKASAEKRAAAGNRSATNNPAQEVMTTLRTASTQLHNGQELDAAESYTKAWEAMAVLVKDPKGASAGIGQARTHLREFQNLTGKDPQLVLALMTELAEKQKQAFESVENAKLKPQLASPIAMVWAQLMQMGQLDKESLTLGAAWVMLFPQMVIADRALSEEQGAEYDRQLTQLSLQVTAKLRQMAERQLLAMATQQRGPAVRPMPPQGVNPGAEAPESVDPMLAQAIAAMDSKRSAITRFMEADIHFQWGQFRRGVSATAEGWKELLEFYRGNARSITPLDAQAHFDTLDQTAVRNPVQAVVLLDQLDPAYRGMAQMDRFFAPGIADHWMKLSPGLPLNSAMLDRALFWVSSASKLGKEQETQYKQAIEDLGKKLSEARKREGVQAKRGHDDDDDDDDDDKAGGKEDKEDDDKPGQGEKEDDDDKAEQRGVGGQRIPLPPALRNRKN